MNGRLFFKTRTGLIARVLMGGPVIYTDHRLGTIAPKVARRDVFSVFIGEGLFRGVSGVQFFRAEMFAKCLAHASPFNLSNVRRMSACAMGTL